MGEEISIVIDKLCEKLGTTIEYFIPEYAKYNIASAIYVISICILLIIVSAVIIRKCKKNLDDDDYYNDDWAMGVSIVFFAVLIIAIVVAFIFLHRLIMWNISPLSSTVNRIVGYWKG